MEPGIIAIGTASPPNRIEQLVVAELMINILQLSPAEARRLRALYQVTGIDNRYSVLGDFSVAPEQFEFFPKDINQAFPTTAQRMAIYRQHALSLVLSAVRNCLSALDDFNLQDITHVITVSCTGMYAPGLDIELVHALNLSMTVKRTAVNFMGCYGVFNALRLANSICEAQIDACVLVVSVELCTLHFQKSNLMNDIVAASLFGDGAGAAIVRANKTEQKLAFKAFHCDLIPSGSAEMTWQIGDSGFDMMLSSYVPALIGGTMQQFFDRFLQQANLDLAQIDYFGIHPGGRKILEACESALNISASVLQHSYEVLRQNGTMSSVTILFVLKAMWQSFVKNDQGKHIWSCAFGPGLTLESMLLQIH